MPSKSRKSKKQKRAPVRLITPKTVDVPSEAHTTRTKEVEGETAAPIKQEVMSESRKSSLVAELKRIGIIFAVVTALMILLAIIF